MASGKLDAVVLTLPHHVYWASGYRPHWLQQAAVIVWADGRSSLIAAAPGPASLFVDEVRTFPANFAGTQRQEQPALVATLALDVLGSVTGKRIGIDSGAGSVGITQGLGTGVEIIDPMLWQLRRRKEADELKLMTKAIECTVAMYQRAREIIAPGVPELTVFNELHAAAVRTAGEPLSAILGNDFTCGGGGGPARASHVAAAGELYILDLGPAYRGYFADNARTFSVDRHPTDIQNTTQQAIDVVLTMIATTARPGVRCQDLYNSADAILREKLNVGIAHHLGHGVGLQPHEYPHLNPHWNDVLIEGEVFTAEPGVYGADLHSGMRIENQYVVTADGVRNLLDIPTGLV